METYRKDTNLLLHILKITEAGEAIINKYKYLNITLSLVHNTKGENEIDEKEQKKFISCNELLEFKNIFTIIGYMNTKNKA